MDSLFGILITFFLPGFTLTLALFPADMKKIERAVLGSTLSIALFLLSAISMDIVLGIDYSKSNMYNFLTYLSLFFIGLWIIQKDRFKKKSLDISRDLKDRVKTFLKRGKATSS